MRHQRPAARANVAPSPTVAGPLVPTALPETDAARYLSLSRAYLRKCRHVGGGPQFARLGRTVRYRIQDLDRFLENHLVSKVA